jgi:hypothetical protein
MDLKPGERSAIAQGAEKPPFQVEIAPYSLQKGVRFATCFLISPLLP